ncbi:MAG: hypothetical protein R2758_02840 [Bacteroidales bacterium]
MAKRFPMGNLATEQRAPFMRSSHLHTQCAVRHSKIVVAVKNSSSYRHIVYKLEVSNPVSPGKRA